MDNINSTHNKPIASISQPHTPKSENSNNGYVHKKEVRIYITDVNFKKKFHEKTRKIDEQHVCRTSCKYPYSASMYVVAAKKKVYSRSNNVNNYQLGDIRMSLPMATRDHYPPYSVYVLE